MVVLGGPDGLAGAGVGGFWGGFEWRVLWYDATWCDALRCDGRRITVEMKPVRTVQFWRWRCWQKASCASMTRWAGNQFGRVGYGVLLYPFLLYFFASVGGRERGWDPRWCLATE